MSTLPTPPDWNDLPDQERLDHDKRILAERFHWPTRYADDAIALEHDYPAWTVWYHQIDSRTVAAGTFTATLVEPRRHYAPELRAASVDELRKLIKAEEPNRVSQGGTW